MRGLRAAGAAILLYGCVAAMVAAIVLVSCLGILLELTEPCQ